MPRSCVLTAWAVSAWVTTAAAWWRDEPRYDRGPAPYPYPSDRKYNPANAATPGAIDDSKINVHLVPHTHDDTGWQVTVDQYFFDEVYYVVDTVVDQLLKDPNRHFIYVEVGFFARWWDEQSDERRNVTRQLVHNGQLEFINGAWCMHDEASPFYVEMIDQTTRGHQFLLKNFGPAAIPRGTWQIDPFGHSNTEAWLLGAESGFESLYWGRTDYQDMKLRTSYEGHQNNQWPQWVWQGSQSLGSSAQLMAGQLGSGGYGTHIGWDNDGGAVQDNPSRHDYNLDEMVDNFIAAAIQQQNYTKTNHQMWACGSDFQYQNADHWFHNLDKIIHYVNLNASLGGPVKAFYSTPSLYTDSLKKVTTEQSLKWEVRSDDVFPLANDDHAYWSGYFTSRPSLKRQVRFASNFLNAARQMEIFAKVTKADVNVPTTRPSPVVGASWTDSLEGTIGVATHHDGMSGTERQSVSDDYSQRISESHFEVEAGVALALQRFSGSNNTFGHCNCNEAGNCLNISVCSYTTSKNSFTAVAWNPLGQPTTDTLINVPVTGGSWKIVDSQTGKVIPSQCTPLDNRTLSLPLLYINYYKMSPRKAAAAEAAMQNPATHVLSFVAALPAVGYASFEASVLADGTSEISSTAQKSQPATVSNGIYELTLDWQNNVISSIKNLKSGVESPLTLDWGYYTSNKGGCSYFNNGTKFGCKSKQASGAYLFRPINQTTLSALDDYGQGYGKPTMNVITGSLFTEIRQEYSKYATHVIRMKQNSAYVEIEWTAGPIPGGPISLPPLPAPGGCVGWKQTQQCNAHGPPDPTHDKPCNQSLPSIGNSGYCLCAKNVKVYGSGCGGPSGVKNCNEACSRPVPQFKLAEGKEVVLKVGTDVKSQGTFYTDSNGREMVRRGRDKRGPSYPPLVVNEPVAGNYYPVNSMISLDDGDIELALVTDVSMGGSSMVDGELEVMLHRRIQTDDHRGVQEPLNETMCGCNDIGAAPGSMGAHGHEGDGGCECAGLTMRGSVYLIFDKMDEAHAVRRQLIESLNFPPTLAFTTGPLKKPTYSAVSTALPANVKLMTLTSNYADVHGGAVLLRLAHMYAVDEHSTLSAPATVDLKALFQNSGFSVSTATEMTVTGNQPRSNFKPFSWPTEDVTGGHMRTSANVADVRIPFNPRDMVATLRPMEVKTFLITFA